MYLKDENEYFKLKKKNTNWIVMVLTDPFDQIDGNSPSRETFAAIGHKSPPPTATAK